MFANGFQVPHSGNLPNAFEVVWSPKLIHATPGSRTAINADIANGHVLVLDPILSRVHAPQFQASGDTDDADYNSSNVGLLHYAQAATGYLYGAYAVVVDGNSQALLDELNTIDDPTNASTLRRGGRLKVRVGGLLDVLVANGAALGNKLKLANGSFAAAVVANNVAVDTADDVDALFGTCFEANSSGGNARRMCAIGTR